MEKGLCPCEVFFLTSPDSKQNLKEGGSRRTLCGPMAELMHGPVAKIVAWPVGQIVTWSDDQVVWPDGREDL